MSPSRTPRVSYALCNGWALLPNERSWLATASLTFKRRKRPAAGAAWPRGESPTEQTAPVGRTLTWWPKLQATYYDLWGSSGQV